MLFYDVYSHTWINESDCELGYTHRKKHSSAFHIGKNLPKPISLLKMNASLLYPW
jgi:hypothetical protein